jgi:ribose-phosphate pyrophosphokinase
MDMRLTVLAGSANVTLAASIAQKLGVTPCARVLQRFADGELHVEIAETIRGHDVYVVQPTSLPVDEHLMELVFLADACRRAGAARQTAVLPYFGYARQDRRASGREAVAARVVASLIEDAGYARVITIDLHAPEIEGFFRIPLEHLSAARLLAAAAGTTADSVIVAPDLGAVRLARRYHALLNAPIVVIHKTRASGSEVSVRTVLGDVRGRSPIIVDDMISTGSTIEAAVNALVGAGCKPEVSVLTTHALFVGPAVSRLQALPIRQLIGTDTVESTAELPPHFQVINVAAMLAEAIARLHRDQSLADLLAHS